MKLLKYLVWTFPIMLLAGAKAMASEADLAIPNLDIHGSFKIGETEISAGNLLFYGSFVILGTLGISLYQLFQIHKQPAHKSMLDVAEIIFQTCKTYLIQQGKFLLMLFAIIAVAMSYYFLGLKGEKASTLVYVLLFSVVGMGGSYLVAWYGIRVNTFANEIGRASCRERV
jgi:K(+)-stimulated pyrophosphate-energized sodium pump